MLHQARDQDILRSYLLHTPIYLRIDSPTAGRLQYEKYMKMNNVEHDNMTYSNRTNEFLLTKKPASTKKL